MIQDLEKLSEIAYETMMERFDKVHGWPEGIERITWSNENEPTKNDWRHVIKIVVEQFQHRLDKQ